MSAEILAAAMWTLDGTVACMVVLMESVEWDDFGGWDGASVPRRSV